MVLNIFPRRERPQPAPVIEPESTLPEPSAEALEEPVKKTTRRGTRGGRGRRKPGAETLENGVAEEVAEESAPAEATPAPAARTRRPRGAKAAAEAPAVSDEPAAEPAPATRRAPAARKSAAPAASDAMDLSSLIRAVEAQGRQIEQLVRANEDSARRGGTPAPGGVAPARVGVFVDSANVELAIDRLRARVDWRKVLAILTDGRVLVRAMAYSPVHDDPGVSIETQRFAEPFLGKGFKVVTKPLKRFADGTIKANVDIEMALDIIEMLDRLDVVCLVSGDGDFQRLVEVVQSKGVRVEVVAVGTSTAANLRNAADQYIDIASILPKVRA
ncbi:MAG: NYN domain-containing protein [bacterium]